MHVLHITYTLPTLHVMCPHKETTIIGHLFTEQTHIHFEYPMTLASISWEWKQSVLTSNPNSEYQPSLPVSANHND